jgi:hypothetical protein
MYWLEGITQANQLTYDTTEPLLKEANEPVGILLPQ